ncbi:MAG: ribonuclease Y [Synergistaceae bacterium]|nr:ribonuclease Y [Synergistaceae bacterium]
MIFAIGLACLAAGALIGFAAHQAAEKKKYKNARTSAETVLVETKRKAEQTKREIVAEGKEEVHRMRQEFERDTKERRAEIQRAEKRLDQKEENLDKKLDNVSRKEDELRNREIQIQEKANRVAARENELVDKLEQIARLTREEAKAQLLAQVETEAQHQIGIRLKVLEEKAKREADKTAQDIIATAIQRCGVEFTSDAVVTAVAIPSDEMKGRIIGREGRNIRTFETLTGVDLIVDDSPEVVTLSSFDPVRREVARVSLERLVADGRIHPTRIEEIIAKAEKDVQEQVLETADAALMEVGVKNMNDNLAEILGQLRFRTSYGQNALHHSLEVAHLSGILAAELGVDQALAARAGLLHDIGKAVDFKIEGPHAQIGANLAKRYGEDPVVINAIAAHHEEEEAKTIYAVIVAAADAISAARPGARRESLEAYVKRLEQLEEIAKGFEGVGKAFAIQAGREVRVVVEPSVTDDGAMQKLAYDIARRIEAEMRYPGQIKVTLVRETRAVDYAK